jgi:hypothetical protein
MALPLEVLADLQLAVDGEPIDIQADGDRIVVNLPSLQAGRRLLAAEPIARWPQQASRRAQEALDLAGLTLVVQLRGDVIAVVGAGAEPGRAARLLRLDGVELRPAQTLRLAARQRPLFTAAVIGGLLVFIGWLVARIMSSE